MTKSLAVEWAGAASLNAIAGVIPTEGASARLRPNDSGTDALVKQNPMQRLGQGQDIGELAAFLLAPGNDWINGQTIALDGATTWPMARTSSSISIGRTKIGPPRAPPSRRAPPPTRRNARRARHERIRHARAGRIIAGDCQLDRAALMRRGEQVAAAWRPWDRAGRRGGGAAAQRHALPGDHPGLQAPGLLLLPDQLALHADEVAYLVRDSGARLLIAEEDLWQAARAALPADLPSRRVGAAAVSEDYASWREAQAPYDGPVVAPRGHMAYTPAPPAGRRAWCARFPLDQCAAAGGRGGGGAGVRLAARLPRCCPRRSTIARPVFAQVALRVCETLVLAPRFDPLECCA
ncbi:2-dehydro-3-deoxy-D-gluconate 5-dehydrogenase [Achromobacter xylosoxidans]|nr:2-dehydro-3-deoxy-D-gluconate 5-dehydrogenase [Achromobacter xylosoxidans]